MKFPHVAACSSGVNDTITVHREDTDPEVYLVASGSRQGSFFSVYLEPADARLLAKALKKAAKRAEANQ